MPWVTFVVPRVTFLLLLDALRLWNTHCPGNGGWGGAVGVVEVYKEKVYKKKLSSVAVIKQFVSFNLH